MTIKNSTFALILLIGLNFYLAEVEASEKAITLECDCKNNCVEVVNPVDKMKALAI